LEALSESIITTDIADQCTEQGIPFRTAHAAIGKAIRIAEEENLSLNDTLSKELLELGFNSEVISPSQAIEKRNQIGGTASTAVLKQIECLRKSLGDNS